MPPKISVVIPTYNRAYIIREALESGLAQTYRDLEIVLVDDGSSDNTREVVAGFRDERVRHIWHKQNRGYSAAMNSGISAATGELVAFLDSDDLWKPDYLERQVDFMTKHPEVDAVFCDVEIRGQTGVRSLTGFLKAFPKLLEPDQGGLEYVFTTRQMYLCLLEEVPIKPSAFVVKREVFARAGVFDESWPSGTDWDVFLRISRLACFGYIHLPLAIQRRTPDATHQKFREKDKLFLLELFSRERKRLQNDPRGLQAIKRGLSDHCNNLGFLYLESGRRLKSAAAYWRGFRETRDPMMLVRALFAVLAPKYIRNLIRKLLGRKPL